MSEHDHCPCGTGLVWLVCCGGYLANKHVASTAVSLMRSRYTAYTLKDEAYLLATWHVNTRPSVLNLAEDDARWLDLKVLHDELVDDRHATVEFVARYKIAGRAYRLHETSRFVLENGRWFYVDGEVR
jgi:SEC-C motif-containing protein